MTTPPNPVLPTSGGQRLLLPKEESRLFWRMRTRLMRTALGEVVATSRLRLGVLLFLCLIFWGALFFSFKEGFLLLEAAIAHPATRAVTVQAVFNIFFLALLGMLCVSSAVIFYSACFRSEEVRLLLSTPSSTTRILLHKFQETALYSCWGFILLGSPMLIAYGMVSKAPWYYFAMLPPFMISFVCIPAALGSIICVLFVYWLPSVRLNPTAMAVAAGVLAFAVLGWFLWLGQSEDVMTPAWLEQMLARLRFAEQRLLPSWWLSSGLLEAAHAGSYELADTAWRESVMFLGLLISNALVAIQVMTWTGERVFRRAYSRLVGVASSSRKVRLGLLDRTVAALTGAMPHTMRLLIIKDLRIFRRDPIQFSQFLIFFGLLALYFLNIRRFQYGESLTRWMNMIGFLNLAVVGLILSTFTTRFIFPMISLEGRRFWILGTLPLRRDTILWSKFVFACCGCIVPCATLILLSDAMLGIVEAVPLVAVVHQVVCWTLCLGLSALAVGLGARLPNLRESSPSKIAAGFGGTLNLVLSSLFILTVVLLTAVPSYFLLEARNDPAMAARLAGTWKAWIGLGSPGALVLGTTAAVWVGVVTVYVPLRIGMRSFRQLEF